MITTIDHKKNQLSPLSLSSYVNKSSNQSLDSSVTDEVEIDCTTVAGWRSSKSLYTTAGGQNKIVFQPKQKNQLDIKSRIKIYFLYRKYSKAK